MRLCFALYQIRYISRRRCEAGEVVEADLFLEGGDLFDDLLETVFAEELTLSVLELVAELFVLRRGDDLVESREEDGVLPRFVRAVHPHEQAQRAQKLFAVGSGP